MAGSSQEDEGIVRSARIDEGAELGRNDQAPVMGNNDDQVVFDGSDLRRRGAN